MTPVLVIWLVCFALLPYLHTGEIYEGALLPRLFLLQAACLALLVTLVLTRSRVEIPRRLSGLTALWILVLLLSTISAVNRIESFVQVSHYLSLALIGLLAAVTLDATRLLFVLRAIVFASIPISLTGIAQYLGIDPFGAPSQAPPSAFSYHRNALAAYLTGVIPIACTCTALHARSRVAWVYSSAAAFAFVLLVFTRTRGAWLGIAVSAVVVGVVWIRTRPTRAELSARLLPHITVIALCILAAGTIPDRIATSGPPIFDDKKPTALGALTSITSASGHRGRYGLWEKTTVMISDHPVFGVGIGNWEFQYPRYAGGDHINRDAAPRRPHNLFLWLLSETGILGFAAFLALCAATVRIGLDTVRIGDETQRTIALGLMVVIGAHLVDSMFNFPRERVEAASLFWLSLGGLWVVNPRRTRTTRVPVYALVLALVVVGWSLEQTVRRIRYDYHHLRVHAAERRADWDTVIEQGHRALEHGRFRANTWIAMGRAYYRKGAIQEAIDAQEAALKLHPNSLNAHNNLGIAYRKARRTEESIASLERAIEILPGFIEARNNLGNALRDAGRLEEAIAVLEELVKQNVPSQVHVNLGRAYLERGDAMSARRSFEEALKVDPRNRAARSALQALDRVPRS